MDNEKLKELCEKYNINLEKLKKEQLELAKGLEIKDSLDFSLVERYGAIENLIIKNKIISAMIVCDKDFEIVEEAYFLDTLRFPYIFGFKAYRELPAMSSVFNKIKEKPDVIFIKGNGIANPRLGMASHFSLVTGIPSIGIADDLFDGVEVKKEDIILDKNKVGKIFISRPGSKPMYVSPGNKISIDTSLKLVKDTIVLPHKMPEPLHLARKYAKDIKKELNLD